MKRNFILVVLSSVVSMSMLLGLTSSSAKTIQSTYPGWKQVNISGFGNPNSFSVNRISVFDNHMYAGTRNDTTGGELWLSSDGNTWNQATIGGFNTISNLALLPGEAFKGYLYMGTHNPTQGAEIWRTSGGDSWEQVVDGGFNGAANASVERVVVFKDMLYATVNNDVTGVEVWKSSSGDEFSWTQCNPDGFGDSNNNGLWAVEVLEGYLYVATAQTKGGGTGVEVWRTDDGTNWDQVNVDGFGYDSMMNPWIESFKGYLYLLSGTPGTATQIWRCDICDGTDWERVVNLGFGNLNNSRGEYLLEYEDYLYASTVNEATGTEIWRTTDGTRWGSVMTGGFGDAHNVSIWSGAIFNGQLFFGTLNNAGWLLPAEGTQIWKFVDLLRYLPLVMH